MMEIGNLMDYFDVLLMLSMNHRFFGEKFYTFYKKFYFINVYVSIFFKFEYYL